MNLLLLSVIILIFLAILTTLAYHAYKQTVTDEDYLIAGRNINPGIMALSYGATFISTSAIVGFGGAAGLFGFSLLWLAFLTIVLGIMVAFALFGVRIRRMSVNLNVSSFPSLLGRRYDSNFLTVFSGFMIFIFMPAYTSIILVGGARFFEEALEIDYNLALFILAIIVGAYVLSGGIKAVMYTDAFCALVMLVGMIALLITAYSVVGGVISSHQALTDLSYMIPENLIEAGHRGWTAMPETGSPIWLQVITNIILGVGIGVLAQPQLAMRFMTVPSTKSLYRAIAVGGFFIFFMTGTAFIVGPLSNLYFYEATGMISVEAAGGNTDRIIPLFISEVMPSWFLYLFMVTLISAAISTLSSLVHVQGTALSKDIIGPLSSDDNDKKRDNTLLARIGVLIAVLLAILLAYVLPGSIIARATSFWFGICAASFLPTLIGTLFWPASSRVGAISSVVTGLTVSIFGYAFLHISESEVLGLSRLIFGKDALLPFPWTHIDPLVYSIALSGIVFVVVSLFTKPVYNEHLEICYKGVKKL